jgi:hypothetical protein
MSGICIFTVIGTFVFLPMAQASAQDLPIFDAHVHYNQPDWSVYSTDAILKLFDQAGVQWALVSSTPDDGTVRLFEKAPNRIVPILRPYRTQSDMGSWRNDSSILTYVEKRLEKGIYWGIGEFHISAGQTNTTVVRGFVNFAAQRGILLHAHTDDVGVEELLRFDPKVQILWAHAGMSARPETIRRLLDRYPMLSVELSIRGDVAPGGRLDPAWQDLFLRHSDRFLVGSDTWVTSRWESFVAIHADIRTWLNQLPRDVAEKLSFRNGLRLIGKP